MSVGTSRSDPYVRTARQTLPSYARGQPRSGSERCRDRPGALARGLVGVDRLALLERQTDVVEPVEQPVLDLRVDLERRAAAGPADLLGREVHLALARLRECVPR